MAAAPAESRTIPSLLLPGQANVPVWTETDPKDDAVWERGVLLSQSGPLATVRLEKTQVVKQVDLRVSRMELANQPTNSPPPDLTSLYHINESAILEALEARSLKDDPYSFIGPVLVAVNPLKRIDDPAGALGTAKASEQPHPFAVAESAYSQMSFAADSRRQNKQPGEITNQSVIAGGESGAGKTESAKMVLRHLVARTSGGSSTIDKRLLGSNPVTEAFGNAQTLRNDNSSRFGKLLRLHFEQVDDKSTGPAKWTIKGASVRTYLLERSRVSLHQAGERNFHVFYLTLASPPAVKTRLGYDAVKEFRYLRALTGPEAPISDSLPGAQMNESKPTDAQEFTVLLESFKSLGLDEGEIDSVLDITASVLHMGNVEFDNDESNNEGEVAVIRNKQALEQCAKLLQVKPEALSKILTEREITVRGETTVVRRNALGACFARDAVAKFLFSALFDFIVRRINVSLDDSAGHQDVSKLPSVGVLDIFGFESFQVNGFEQLMINFANEALQNTFNKSVFIAEADLYKAEGLVLDRPMEPPPDNSPTMELLLGGGKVKLGLLMTIDAQAQVPQANDAAMTSALHKEFATHSEFVKPHPKDRGSQFLVRHYAGTIAYTVQAFVEKNNDKLPDEVGAMFASSQSNLIAKQLFQVTDADKKRARSVVAKFAASIKDLISDLELTKVSFIRCVKPNPEMKRQGNTWFNRRYSSMQLKCLSIPQTAEVLRSGLPTRVQYTVVSGAYKSALPEDCLAIWRRRGEGSDKTFTAALFFAFEVDKDSYKLGHTRVFFRSGKLAQLDHILNATSRWTPEEKAKVGKRFKYFYIRAMWRGAIVKVIGQNKFIKLFRRARARTQAAVKILAFMRMVPHRRRYLATQKQRGKAKQDQERQERLRKEAAEREAQLKAEEAKREKELEEKIKREKEAMEKAIAEAHALAKKSREEQEALQRERDLAAARAVTAEQKAAEAERLHRQALAAQIIAEAAAREQFEYEEKLRQGKQMTQAERAKALDRYEQELAAQMAAYEARKRAVLNLQQLARREALKYQQQVVDFLNSPEVQEYLQRARNVIEGVQGWVLTRVLRWQTEEGRKLDAQKLLTTAYTASELARAQASRARAKLEEQLQTYDWYKTALQQREQLQKMSDEVKDKAKRVQSNGNVFVVLDAEWAKPVVSAGNQKDRLRALLDSGAITPDEWARLVGEVVESVERNVEAKPQGNQLRCVRCGRLSDQADKCAECGQLRARAGTEIPFPESDGWTVAVPGPKGKEIRARIAGTESSLDPDTFLETKLFVVELASGDGGADSVFWRVAHPFSEFVELHREILHDTKHMSKEAKEHLPSFPQAETKPHSAGRRSSLMTFFGGKKKAPAPAAPLAAVSTNTLLKEGESFLRNWLRLLFATVHNHPHPKHPADFFKIKKCEAFFDILANLGGH